MERHAENRELESSALDHVSIIPIPQSSASDSDPCSLVPVSSVRIIENRNPFRVEERREFQLAPFDNESTAAIVERAGVRAADYEFSVNGQRLADDEIWRTVILPGQEIVLFTKAGGGGGGRSLLMLLVAVGVSLFAAGVGIALFMTTMLSNAALYAIMAGVAVGGNLLVSWALAPGLPRPGEFSATYDPTGPKGLAQPGVPVPKGYGLFAWCGNVISSYVNFDGKDAYINVLTCYGWGLAKSVTKPRINSKAISTFQNCSYQVRLGTNDQTPIDGFDKTVNGYPQEIQMLVSSGPIVVAGTGPSVQGLEITVKFPAGLYRVTNDGNYVPLRFIYKVEVAPHGTSSWTSPLFPKDTETIAITHIDGTQTWPNWVLVPTDRFAGSGVVYNEDVSGTSHTPGDKASVTQTVTVYQMDGSHSDISQTFYGEWQPCDPNMNQVRVLNWWKGYRVVQNDTLSAIFDTVSVYGLSAGQWDTRVTKVGYENDTGSDFVAGDSTDAKHICDGWLWNINEVTWSNLSYPNMILVGVKALATSQLSGLNIQVMCDIEHELGVDTVIPAALAGFAHDNPAIVAYDILTNPTYGMAITAANVDVPAFVAWAEFNDELVTNQDGSAVRRHIFNGVFDQAGDAWKVLQTIGNMSRASIHSMGNRYTVDIDAPADPVQLFTVGNTQKDSFQEMWLALDDRCNLIECEFSDAERNYRMDLPVSVMTAEDVNSGLQPKVARTRLIGCTSRDQAWRWAYFQLLCTKLTLRTVQITAPIEAVCCKRGSVIAVQSDITQWAVGGRIQAGSTLTTLVVDRSDLTFAIAAGWTVSVQHPLAVRGIATVLSVAGNIVTMAGALPAGRIVKAVTSDGAEYIVTGYSGPALTISGSVGTLAAGQAVTLYDLNVIDNLNVAAVDITDGGAMITVAGAFSAVPTPDSAWAYGQSAGYQPAKRFRVVGIRRSGDFNFDISALEYNAICYEDAVPNYGEIVGIPDSEPMIANLSLTEVYQSGSLTGNSNTAVVAVGWQDKNTAVGAKVEVQANSGPWNSLGNIQGQGCTFVGYIGTTYQVRVTGFDWAGNLRGTPLIGSITVQASTYAPPNVTGFLAYMSGTSIVLEWAAVTGADHYEIRYADDAGAASWITSAVLWDGSGTTWTDATVRNGIYMIVAVSSLATGSVESIQPATCQASIQFASTTLVSSISAPTPQYEVSGYDPGTAFQVNLGAQVAVAADGTTSTIAAQNLLYTGLTTGTAYYFYIYLDSAMTLQGIIPPGSTPDTTPNAAHAVEASQNGVAAWVFSRIGGTGFGTGGGGQLPPGPRSL